MSSFCDELAEDASDKPRRGTTDCENNSLGTSHNMVIGTICFPEKFSRIPCDRGAGGTGVCVCGVRATVWFFLWVWFLSP